MAEENARECCPGAPSLLVLHLLVPAHHTAPRCLQHGRELPERVLAPGGRGEKFGAGWRARSSRFDVRGVGKP